MTSPPAVIDDEVIVGSAINDNQRVDMPAGVVRSFAARTGALRWSWDPIPSNAASIGEGDSERAWKTGAANAWSTMAVDLERDLILFTLILGVLLPIILG
jgi:quinoprotein glucose dehydrogenase